MKLIMVLFLKGSLRSYHNLTYGTVVFLIRVEGGGRGEKCFVVRKWQKIEGKINLSPSND